MKINLRMMLGALTAAILLVGGLAAHGQSQNAKKDAPPKRIAIRAGRLIDGKSDSAIQNAVIVIEGDKIVSVASGGAVPAGVETIDLSHATVMPGFADVHTHVVLNGDITAEDYERAAVETVDPVSRDFRRAQCEDRARSRLHLDPRSRNRRRDVRRR
jgi:imidazolonepropionase-like amidohydrolase